MLSIDIEPGSVRARVQGSRPKPYNVVMKVATLSPAQWETVLEALASQALFAAKLLSGEMPQDIEQVFQSVKPTALSDHEGSRHLLLLPGRRRTPASTRRRSTACWARSSTAIRF